MPNQCWCMVCHCMVCFILALSNFLLPQKDPEGDIEEFLLQSLETVEQVSAIFNTYAVPFCNIISTLKKKIYIFCYFLLTCLRLIIK